LTVYMGSYTRLELIWPRVYHREEPRYQSKRTTNTCFERFNFWYL